MQIVKEIRQTRAPEPARPPGAEAQSSPRSVLRIEGLVKRFERVTAVDGLSLEVRSGEVVGLLGPNGAGKSTTVGAILGLIAPDAGRIEVMGQDVLKYGSVERRDVGAVVEQPAFYPYLSGRDNLRAIALAAGGVPRGRIESLLSLVGLQERATSIYSTYSLGMKQRLGIASTLLTNPALVILDEPSNGLDPAGQREVRELIPRLAQEGHGVLLASHQLHEVEQVCDHVVIIRRGKLITAGTVSELLRKDSFLQIDVDESAQAAAVLHALPFVRQITINDGGLSVTAPPNVGKAINRALAERGIYASAIGERTNSLEEIFLELTEPDAPARREQST